MEKRMSSTLRPSADTLARAHVNAETYNAMYAAWFAYPDRFCAEQGKRIDWIKPFTRLKDVKFNFGEVSINWFDNVTQDPLGQDHGSHSAEDRRERLWCALRYLHPRRPVGRR